MRKPGAGRVRRRNSRPRLSGGAKAATITSSDRNAQQNLRGTVALITGASQGIGLAIAQTLAAEGCDLVISGRHQSTLNRAARKLAEYRVRVLPVACDVRDAQQVAAMITAANAKFRRIDILINNAGIAHSSLTVDKLPVDAWHEVMEANLTGMFLVTRAALASMKRGAAIVNNLSIAAKRDFPGASAYSASKSGGFAFTISLREELRSQAIRVIALLPGATDTAIWNALWPDAPRKKMMSPQTVAQAVVNALLAPSEATIEELTVLPSVGIL